MVRVRPHRLFGTASLFLFSSFFLVVFVFHVFFFAVDDRFKIECRSRRNRLTSDRTLSDSAVKQSSWQRFRFRANLFSFQ